MTPDEQLRADLAADTAYERFVLASMTDPNRPPPGSVFAVNDIRGGSMKFARGCHDSIGAGAVEVLAARFRPLAFGAAYKILDFIAEMTMKLNAAPCPTGRWTFEEKRNSASLGRRRVACPSPCTRTPRTG